MNKHLKTAIDAALAGGAVVRGYYEQGTEIRQKSSYDLVSDADLESEEKIVGTIKNAFPDHAFLGEESHKDDVNSPQLWIIDPLDGTNNFAHSIPHFACSIAYVENGQIEVGVVYNPVTGEMFSAVRGEGAFAESQNYEKRAIAVSSAQTLKESMVGVGFYYDRGQMMRDTLQSIETIFGAQPHGIRRLGTASLDLCYVACGRFDAYFEYTLSAWDFAAGALIVEEAGGTISNCLGKSLPLSKSSVLATNGKVHKEVEVIIKENISH